MPLLILIMAATAADKAKILMDSNTYSLKNLVWIHLPVSFANKAACHWHLRHEIPLSNTAIVLKGSQQADLCSVQLLQQQEKTRA